MRILVTGAAGFIGYHLVQELLKKKLKVIGIDNINNYYDPTIKRKRLSILKKNKNFKFFKLDISEKKNFHKIKNIKVKKIYHLAAQAGVRYSFKFPEKYIKSNVVGFFNIIEFARKKKINNIIYASSSSVYGEQKKFPLKENIKLNPKNLYGLTKKNNEEIAEIYSLLYKINFIGLRFFTVFGEYGRPDMFILKFLNSFKKKKPFFLYNFGNHERDFTYAKDVVKIMTKLKHKRKHSIYNICSNNPINLKRVIKIMNKYSIKPKIKKIKFQKGDVIKTHGSNLKILKEIKNFKFTKFNLALHKTITNNIKLL